VICINDKGKVIEGFNNNYYIDKHANIWSKKSNRYLKPYKHNYMYISLTENGIGKKHAVHRLMGEAYLPNPHNLPQIHHRDANPYNNELDNLEWISIADNIHHSYERLSQVRNFKSCVLKYNNRFIRMFKSVTSCSKYCHKELGLSISGMQKYKADRYNKYKIIMLGSINNKTVELR